MDTFKNQDNLIIKSKKTDSIASYFKSHELNALKSFFHKILIKLMQIY